MIFSTKVVIFFQKAKKIKKRNVSEAWHTLTALIACPAVAVVPIAAELQRGSIGMTEEHVVAVDRDGAFLSQASDLLAIKKQRTPRRIRRVRCF